MWSLHSSTGIADKSEARRGAPRSRGVMGWSVCPDRAPPSPLPGTLARSAPPLIESSTTRRSSAAAEPILAGVTPSGPPLEDPTGAQILRHLPAHGCSAIFDLRPSSWRSSDPPRSGASLSTSSVTATPSSGRRVAASTPASTPFVLALRAAGAACVTPGPRRLLRCNQHRTSGASRSKLGRNKLPGGLDRPFHIITGRVALLSLSARVRTHARTYERVPPKQSLAFPVPTA